MNNKNKLKIVGLVAILSIPNICVAEDLNSKKTQISNNYITSNTDFSKKFNNCTNDKNNLINFDTYVKSNLDKSRGYSVQIEKCTDLNGISLSKVGEKVYFSSTKI